MSTTTFTAATAFSQVPESGLSPGVKCSLASALAKSSPLAAGRPGPPAAVAVRYFFCAGVVCTGAPGRPPVSHITLPG
jgi:hypothetical protein